MLARCPPRARRTGSLGPGGGLPVVFALFERNPWGQGQQEIGSQGENIGFVHGTQTSQVEIGLLASEKIEALQGEGVANASEVFGWKAIRKGRARRGLEDLGQIHDGLRDELYKPGDV